MRCCCRGALAAGLAWTWLLASEAVRPGDDVFSRKQRNSGAEAFEALIQMALKPEGSEVATNQEELAATAKGSASESESDQAEGPSVEAQTSFLMSEQLAHLIQALTDEHRTAQSQVAADRVKMRQIDSQLSEDEALLKMLNEQIEKLKEGRMKSIRDSKAALALSTHDRDESQEVAYNVVSGQPQRDYDVLVATTTPGGDGVKIVDWERADDHLTDNDVIDKVRDTTTLAPPKGIVVENTDDTDYVHEKDVVPHSHSSHDQPPELGESPFLKTGDHHERETVVPEPSKSSKDSNTLAETEANVQDKLREEMHTRQKENVDTDDGEVTASMLQLDESLEDSFLADPALEDDEASQEALLQQVHQRVAEVQSNIAQRQASQEELRESVEDHEAIVRSAEQQISDLMQTRSEVVDAIAALGDDAYGFPQRLSQ